MSKLPEIVLASSSPQRVRIMEELAIPFIVVSEEVKEVIGKTPAATVEYNAGLKAETVAKSVEPGRFVLAADTVLVQERKIFGKPRNAAEAKVFLAGFSGKTIEAYTGVAIAHRKTGSCLVGSESAVIIFRSFLAAVIDWYIETGEPLTRAGAFAISKKGELLVDSVRGSYSCIAGLPKYLTLQLLSRIYQKTGIEGAEVFPFFNLEN